MSKSNKNIQIILCGPLASGKSSFATRWTSNKFFENYSATIVDDLKVKVYEHNGDKYYICIWDLLGKDTEMKVIKMFLKDSHGCVIVCDGTKEESIEE